MGKGNEIEVNSPSLNAWIDGDEVAELRFFPLDRLPSPIYPIHLDSIADYREI